MTDPDASSGTRDVLYISMLFLVILLISVIWIFTLFSKPKSLQQVNDSRSTSATGITVQRNNGGQRRSPSTTESPQRHERGRNRELFGRYWSTREGRRIFLKRYRPPYSLKTETTESPWITLDFAPTSTLPEAHYCRAEECGRLTRILRTSIRLDKNPCDDFYSYVCSGLHPILPPGRHSILDTLEHSVTANVIRHSVSIRIPQSRQTAFEKASAFYKSCVMSFKDWRRNRDSLANFLLENSLGFTANTKFDPIECMIRLIFTYGMHVVLRIDVQKQFLYKGRYLFLLEESDEFRKWRQDREKLTEGYAIFVAKVLQVLDINEDPDESALIHNIKSAEGAVMKISVATYEDPSASYIFNLSSIGYWMDSRGDLGTSWISHMVKHSHGYLPGDSAIKGTARSFHILRNLLTHFHPDDLKLYLTWEVTRQMSLMAGVVGSRTALEVRSQCFGHTVRLLRHAFVAPYLLSAVNQSRLNAVRHLAKNIRYHFAKTISRSTLLDQISRRASLQKIYSMRWKIAYPKGKSDRDSINRLYRYYPDVRGPFLTACTKTWRAHMASLIDFATTANPDVVEADFDNMRANAFYVRGSNMVVVPATSLLPPVYAHGAPTGINYGGLGRLVSHEIMHAFDAKGVQHNQYGRNQVIWTKRVRRKSLKKLKCLSTVSRSSTFRSEITADFVGLQSLHKAYKNAKGNSSAVKGLEYFTNDQLFFVNWCFSFCDNEAQSDNKKKSLLRCNIPLMNSKEFASAFRCPRRSPMNPRNKCTYW
ncbi:neprilysin-1-like [Ornithodoros turicata]|uniref:neprilysin-1-like n=1 Tax=Ornithodoros turicata TaxID=34597 RepID=UPI00313A1FCC